MSEDTATVTCRFCGTQNRLPVEKALADLSKAVCGKCHSGLLRVHGEPLTDLRNEDISHPWDREARAKLEALPFVEEVLSKVLSSTFDKFDRFRHLGGGIKVSDRQAPRLHRLYLEAAGRLDVEPPPLFLVQSPVPNAYTSGAGAPIVVVTTALVDLLDDRGLVGVFGHELTHVKLEHVLFRKVAELLALGALKALNLAGLANIALTPIKALLFKWYQMSELSADRGELIASGSLATHVRTSMLLAGGSAKLADELDIAAYIDQAHEAEAMRDGDLLISISELFENQARSHPVSVWRVHHILEWARTQTFFDVLAGRVSRGLGDAMRLGGTPQR
jgi:Zn-dependent protease with chaperone function